MDKQIAFIARESSLAFFIYSIVLLTKSIYNESKKIPFIWFEFYLKTQIKQ